MLNLNEDYSNSPAAPEGPKIIPLIFMVSLEPVIVRFGSEAVPDDEKIQEIVQANTFDVTFSVIKEIETQLNVVTFLVKPRGSDLVQNITEKFEDIESEEAKEFIRYSFNVFEPYKRAILSFDGQERDLIDTIKLVRDWKLEVKQELEQE